MHDKKSAKRLGLHAEKNANKNYKRTDIFWYTISSSFARNVLKSKRADSGRKHERVWLTIVIPNLKAV